MADTLTKTIKELLKTIKEFDKRKTSPYDTRAEVIRVDGNIAYVHIPGGVAETPVDMTVNAKAGDMVQVRVSGGRAWIIGNATAPPTDDVVAIQATNEARNANTNASRAKKVADKASDEAAEAYQFAGTAVEAANIANRAANSALESAETAHQAADAAVVSANEAKESARSANNSANNALIQLGIVEDVAGTLRWISEHGDYVLTNDDHVYSDTVYFIKQGNDYIPIASPDPTKNPSTEGWYVLDVSQSTTDYIMAHLAVTTYGLWVLPVNNLAEHYIQDSNGNLIIDSNGNKLVDFSNDPQKANGYKVLLSGGTSDPNFPIGLSIFNDEGALIANYGENTTIGEETEYNVHITNQYVQIRDDDKVLAQYGATTIIGEETGNNVFIENGGVSLRYGQNVMASFSRQNGIVLGEEQDIHIGNVEEGSMIDTFEVGSHLTFTLSHSLNAITNIFAQCKNSTTGEFVGNVPLTSSDYSVSGDNVTITNPLASDNNLIPEELTVWYTTNDIIIQLSIGKNADIDDARNFPLVIGNNNETLDPSNMFAVNWSGQIYAQGHRLPIGYVVIADTNFDTTMTAGIDNFTNYARLGLPRGIYIISARFGLTPSSSSTGCIGLRICKDERDSAHVIHAQRQLGNVGTSYYGEISVSCIVNVTSNTLFYAIASSHYAGTVSARTFKAICIS